MRGFRLAFWLAAAASSATSVWAVHSGPSSPIHGQSSGSDTDSVSAASSQSGSQHSHGHRWTSAEKHRISNMIDQGWTEFLAHYRGEMNNFYNAWNYNLYFDDKMNPPFTADAVKGPALAISRRMIRWDPAIGALRLDPGVAAGVDLQSERCAFEYRDVMFEQPKRTLHERASRVLRHIAILGMVNSVWTRWKAGQEHEHTPGGSRYYRDELDSSTSKIESLGSKPPLRKTSCTNKDILKPFTSVDPSQHFAPNDPHPKDFRAGYDEDDGWSPYPPRDERSGDDKLYWRHYGGNTWGKHWRE